MVRTHGFVSLLLVLVVLLEQQWPPDADLSPGGSAIGVVPKPQCIIGNTLLVSTVCNANTGTSMSTASKCTSIVA